MVIDEPASSAFHGTMTSLHVRSNIARNLLKRLSHCSRTTSFTIIGPTPLSQCTASVIT